MISEEEFQNYEDYFYFEDPENLKNQSFKKIYEITENERIYDVFPSYDLQDEELKQILLEIYKTLFWGISALASTLLWLYFFLT